MSTDSILWIGNLAVAHIKASPKKMHFSLRDDDGTHVTIWLQNGAFRFECSSAQPLSSVWDEARRGIVRDILKYPKWQKHANYFVNRTLDHFADSSIPLITFSMPRRLKPLRPSLRSKPALHLSAPSPQFDLSLCFSPSRSISLPGSVVFEGQIGRLIVVLTRRCSEPALCVSDL